MNDDTELLRRYAEEGSEAAFTELVHRYVDLVYGAALRRTGGDPHRASDVAQQVFTVLAQRAQKLPPHAVLGAWLHTATRNAALNLMISDQRRRARDFEAVALDLPSTSGETRADWDRLRPVLDAAIDELPEPDRTAVILRFLERKAFAEIGGALQVSEDAARMRTDRALDKLRLGLIRRGISSTAAALGSIISSQSAISAPAGFATTLSSQALAAASAGMLTAIISLMNTKIIVASVLTALVAFEAGTYFGQKHGAEMPSQAIETPGQSRLLGALQQSNQSLKDEIAKLTPDISRLTAENARLVAEQRTAPPPPARTLGWMPRYQRQQLMMNYLRQIDAARQQYILEKGHPPESVDVLVGIDGYIKTVRPVSGEDYSGLSMASGQPLSVTTTDGMTVTYDPSGAGTTPVEVPPEVAHADELSRKLSPLIQKAVEAYRAANNGNPPPNGPAFAQALIPYFATPQEGADFVEMIAAQKISLAAQKAAPR